MSLFDVLSAWVAAGKRSVLDPALLQHAIAGLVPPPGQTYGRYASGSRAVAQPATATVASLIAANGLARSQVSSAGDAVTAATALLAPTTALDFVASVLAFAEAIRSAAQDPRDQVRLLIALANFYPVPPASAAPLGQFVVTAYIATGALCRQAALISVARAAADYLPASYDDAVALAGKILPLFDAEITLAADAGSSATYAALRDLRTKIATDLQTRGQSLPRVTTVDLPSPLPAPTIAYRLYRDTIRADDLIARNDPPAPMFMPTELEALAY